MLVKGRLTGPKPFTNLHLSLPCYDTLISEDHDSMPACRGSFALVLRGRAQQIGASRVVNIPCNSFFYLANDDGGQVLLDINPMYLGSPNLQDTT